MANDRITIGDRTKRAGRLSDADMAAFHEGVEEFNDVFGGGAEARIERMADAMRGVVLRSNRVHPDFWRMLARIAEAAR